jgi:putative oxidoreductase
VNDVDAFNLALLLLRVCAGLTLAAHGYNHLFRGGRVAGTGRWFESLGMKPGKLHAMLASVTELAAGFGFAAGLLTPLCAAGFVGCLFVAVWTVHRFNGFFIIKEGWEYVTVLMVLAVSVSMIGPGQWSLDDKLGIADDLDGWTGLLISAGGGLLAAIGLLAVFYRPPAKEPAA